MVELQRRELAKMFRCVPSQINYVLETRFTMDRGFLIESKRGGGGYIRITRIQGRSLENLPQVITQLIPVQVSIDEAQNLLNVLVDKGLLNTYEAQIILNSIGQEFSDLPEEFGDYLRSRFIKALLLVLGSKPAE